MARWDRGDSGSSIPDWFWQAVETEPEVHTVEVDECDVSYRHYRAPGNPGMLLIHGMNAHARWWDFIAPQLLDQYEVVAMDLTGMGDSDYRYTYEGDTYAAEIAAVLDAAGFDNQALVVAHSFGGYMAVRAAALYPDRFGGLILVDSGIRHPDDPLPEHYQNMMNVRAKVYPSREEAVNRFRLQPPQPCENEYVMQYIARNSFMPVDGGGYAWKFDEDLPSSMKDTERVPADYEALSLPLGLIYGEDSELFSKRTLDYLRELVPQEFPAIGIENAQHHVFLDQPLAFVSALRDMAGQLHNR
ncbi:MAG: alpha/beta hydrolase [Pseudomonadota bacterium]